MLELGDESAFRALYDRHTPRLLGLAHQLTAAADRVLAEAVVHDAWVRGQGGRRGQPWRELSIPVF